MAWAKLINKYKFPPDILTPGYLSVSHETYLKNMWLKQTEAESQGHILPQSVCRYVLDHDLLDSLPSRNQDIIILLDKLYKHDTEGEIL